MCISNHVLDVRWKNKFWGKSMEILPIGTVNVMLPRYRRILFFLTNSGSNAGDCPCLDVCLIGMFCAYSYGDHYEWNKVTTCVHNILSGRRWIEHYGEITIRNTKSSACLCKLTFIKVFKQHTLSYVCLCVLLPSLYSYYL